jgi:hypothetical protein
MSGRMCGRQHATTTARIAAHVTCHRIKVKTRRTAHPIEAEAVMPKKDKSGRTRELNDVLRSTFSDR